MRKNKYSIAVIEGDGIGKEVMPVPQLRKIVAAQVPKKGFVYVEELPFEACRS